MGRPGLRRNWARGAARQAEALLVIEAESGKVIHAHNAGQPWYPASVTKVMTAYVTLRAVKEGRLTLETPLTVSANASAQAPVKMGFRAGTTVTVDNALKMLMVKSANDIAVVLAEGVAGSVENFADLMNRHARRLGMTQSTFVNPNGLPADDQISSARDLAILARAVIREMPEYDYYWNLPGIRMGKMVQRNYNTLIGRYPGADGMKTGFICASGFNLVASATRDGKRVIAVVLGAPFLGGARPQGRPIARARLQRQRRPGLVDARGWARSSRCKPIDAAPPNLRDEMCGGHRKRPATEDEDEHLPANTAHRFPLRRVPGEPASEAQGRAAPPGQQCRPARAGVYRHQAAGAGRRHRRIQTKSGPAKNCGQAQAHDSGHRSDRPGEELRRRCKAAGRWPPGRRRRRWWAAPAIQRRSRSPRNRPPSPRPNPRRPQRRPPSRLRSRDDRRRRRRLVRPPGPFTLGFAASCHDPRGTRSCCRERESRPSWD